MEVTETRYKYCFPGRDAYEEDMVPRMMRVKEDPCQSRLRSFKFAMVALPNRSEVSMKQRGIGDFFLSVKIYAFASSGQRNPHDILPVAESYVPGHCPDAVHDSVVCVEESGCFYGRSHSDSHVQESKSAVGALELHVRRLGLLEVFAGGIPAGATI